MSEVRGSHLDHLPAPTSYVQYKGIWDMQDLYEFLSTFFAKRKYKFYESKYIVKHPGPFGPETYYVWNAEQEWNEYVLFYIKLYLHTYDTQDVEVTMNTGEKHMFTKGRIWIQFKGGVKMDYEGRWEENAFFRNLKSFYHNYVIWKKIQGIYWDDMYYNVLLKCHSMVKERLKMQSDAYEHRNFNKVR